MVIVQVEISVEATHQFLLAGGSLLLYFFTSLKLHLRLQATRDTISSVINKS